jgi:hypothetical protein
VWFPLQVEDTYVVAPGNNANPNPPVVGDTPPDQPQNAEFVSIMTLAATTALGDSFNKDFGGSVEVRRGKIISFYTKYSN